VSTAGLTDFFRGGRCGGGEEREGGGVESELMYSEVSTAGLSDFFRGGFCGGDGERKAGGT